MEKPDKSGYWLVRHKPNGYVNMHLQREYAARGFWEDPEHPGWMVIGPKECPSQYATVVHDSIAEERLDIVLVTVAMDFICVEECGVEDGSHWGYFDWIRPLDLEWLAQTMAAPDTNNPEPEEVE